MVDLRAFAAMRQANIVKHHHIIAIFVGPAQVKSDVLLLFNASIEFD